MFIRDRSVIRIGKSRSHDITADRIAAAKAVAAFTCHGTWRIQSQPDTCLLYTSETRSVLEVRENRASAADKATGKFNKPFYQDAFLTPGISPL